ncbi:phage holin family protein [Bacillus horti]|uniref:Toxin secretion/phage lysis holin n=1 Tax=Caldalkalibacillus horti TaxID=77523 RepID=A0ABT9W084_9BACI|nr:holin family protein [Bacillus horti]MDQ0166653.1 toxin secretion/phage lysis holin [Bacillus horti]
METILKVIVGFTGASISYLWGEWTALLNVLFVLVIIDYISGLVASGFEGKISSNTGMKGIAKKVFIFAIVAIAHLVDTALGESHLFRDAAIFFYIANELISIIENGGRMGVPIPPGIQKAVEVLKRKGERDA